MNIEEYGRWNSFFVPVPAREGETQTLYLERVRDLLRSFHQEYGRYKHQIPLEGHRLESLMEEGNFCEFHLDGIPYCDVKYFVLSPEERNLTPGIRICSHGDNKFEREPRMNFLREKWSEFDPPSELSAESI